MSITQSEMDFSSKETKIHIGDVRQYLLQMINLLSERAINHDQSKLSYPELDTFAEHTPKLKSLTYGSPEYQQSLEAIKPALKHHYQHNPHHPEHYQNGVSDMSLIDIVEMLSDWKAASIRHSDGDIFSSIEKSCERFKIDPMLKQIFINTARLLGW